MNIIKDSVDDSTILAVDWRLHTANYPQLESYLADLLKEGATQIILDLDKLEYISSSGLRVILKTLKQLDERGGKLLLCGLNDHIMEIFKVSGFTELFQITPTREEALKKI